MLWTNWATNVSLKVHHTLTYILCYILWTYLVTFYVTYYVTIPSSKCNETKVRTQYTDTIPFIYIYVEFFFVPLKTRFFLGSGVKNRKTVRKRCKVPFYTVLIWELILIRGFLHPFKHILTQCDVYFRKKSLLIMCPSGKIPNLVTFRWLSQCKK